MPRFSAESIAKLSSCHLDLQTLFYEVIKNFDCIVIQGHRGEAEQNAAFALGNSQLKYPNGKHNAVPSLAVDVAPYDITDQIDWKDESRFCYFAGYVKGIATILEKTGKMKSTLRWGGDWNSDNVLKNEKFRDLVHFELVL